MRQNQTSLLFCLPLTNLFSHAAKETGVKSDDERVGHLTEDVQPTDLRHWRFSQQGFDSRAVSTKEELVLVYTGEFPTTGTPHR